jgi:hypothetical protein
MVNKPPNSAPRGREHGAATDFDRDLVSTAKTLQKIIDTHLEKVEEGEKGELLRAQGSSLNCFQGSPRPPALESTRNSTES